MPNKRKHHYIPQFYIKGFTNNQGHVFVLDKDTKKINKQSENGTFHKYKFYTVDFDKHRQRSYESAKRIKKKLGLEKVDISSVMEYPDIIEDLLGESESASALIIRKLINSEKINRREKLELSTFIALMYTRNPLFHNFVSEMEQNRIHEILHDTEVVKDTYNKMLKKGYESKTSTEDLLNCIEKNRYEIEIPKELIVQMMLLGTNAIDKIICNKTWLIIEAPHTTSFITTDQPVFMNHPIALEQGPFSVGVETQGVEVIFPISKEIILIMRKTPRKDDILYKKIDRVGVRKLNELIEKLMK